MAFSRLDTISATDITNCLRGVVYKKQKKEPPPLHPELLAQFDRFRAFGETGQAIQNRLTAFWRAKGSLVSPGDFIPAEEFGFTGRYDAICRIRNALVLYEIKGVSASFFDEVRASKRGRDYHRIQLMVYHHALAERYPGIEPRLLYVSRSLFRKGTLAGVEIPINYTEGEFQKVTADADLVRAALRGGALPPAASAIEEFEGKQVISMNAMLCRHHALCLGNDHWYEDAKRTLGLSADAAAEESPQSEDDLPF